MARGFSTSGGPGGQRRSSQAALAAFETLERRCLMADTTGLVERIGGYDHGGFAEGAAEISAYEAGSKRLFVVNAESDTVDILDMRDPANPVLVDTIDTTALGSPNSVATRPGLVAVAIENHNVQLPGVVAFYTTDGTLTKSLTVGSLPDMLTFSPDGRNLL